MDLNSESLSIKPEAEDNESARDLNKEVCSARLDAEPTEVLRIRDRHLMNEPNILNASVRDLKNELFSLRLGDEPTETASFIWLLLNSEEPRLNEPVKE